MQIRNSIALVTGSNRGIGLEYVRALVAQGAAKVYTGVRRHEYGAELVAAFPGKVEPVVLDITDAAHIAAAAKRCSDINLLINNAGVNHMSGLIAATDLALARNEIETNYLGTLSMCRAFAPVLKANGGGVIVNVASIVARVTLPMMGSLAASKAALLRMTQGVRAELAQQGTLVIAVLPGAVDTKMNEKFPPPKAAPADIAAAALRGVEEGTEEVYPDVMAQRLRDGLAKDPKGVEKQLAQVLPI